MHCDSCEKALNQWCLKCVPGHVDSDQMSAKEREQMEFRRQKIMSLEAEEESFGLRFVEPAVAAGFSLEPNPPPNGLLPRKNAFGAYDVSDPWLLVGDHPEFSESPIPCLYTYLGPVHL